MVPASVRNAWEGLQENRKVAVSRLLARKQPTVFTRWVEAAGLKNFRHESLVNRKAGTGSRLDAVLFTAEEGQLAMDLLVTYFTELDSEINDQYLALLERAGNEEPQTKLKIYAQLVNRFKGNTYLNLYLATALWVEEFQENELDDVAVMAAELAAEKEQ